MSALSSAPSHTIREGDACVGLLARSTDGQWYYEQINGYVADADTLLYIVERLNALNFTAPK